MSAILNKLEIIIDKINKYTHLSFTLTDIVNFVILGFIILLLIFLYFDKISDYIKDNIIKWDNFLFIKLSCLMIIPILSFIGLNFSFTNNININNWIHFFLLFFIIPIIPFTFLCIYRIIFLCIKNLYYFCIKKMNENVKNCNFNENKSNE